MFLILIFLNLSDAIEITNNYSVYEVTAFNSRERTVLYDYYLNNDLVVFLNSVTNEAAIPMDVLVDECCTQNFEKKLLENEIEFIKIIDDVKLNQVNTHYNNITQSENPYVQVPNITRDFHNFATIRLWVDMKKRSTIVKEIVIGHTYEKREIFILNISSRKKSTAVFLLGGEDGKDWMSPAILLNFVNNIIEKRMNVHLLLAYYDFYILPVFNPDGYEYSMKKDRYWSKNRKVFYPKKICSTGADAVGVNLDRNWFFTRNKEYKNEECNSIYGGSKPLSEEETEALSQFLNSIALNMMVFINVKGFVPLVTIPYGYTSFESANNYNILMDILASVQEKIHVHHKTTFYYGSAAKYFYNLSGNSADWVKKKLNTPVVYTIQMKTEDLPLPLPQHIHPLTNQFSTMIMEILLLANNIYNPLFDKQVLHNNCLPITVFIIIFGLYIERNEL